MALVSNVKIIAGRSNPQLASDIATSLGLELTNVTLGSFANGEIQAEVINENLRDSIIYVVQTGAGNGALSINDLFIEALALADLCGRSGAKAVNLICPLYPYARSDKKDKPRVPIMSALAAGLIERAGFDRIICMDIHAAQTQGTTVLPFDNLYAIKLILRHIREQLFTGLTQEQINAQYVLLAPDMGSYRRIRAYAAALEMDHTVMEKRRDYTQKNVVSKSELMGGAVEGKTAIIIDDMVDTMGTMVAAVQELVSHGIKDVIVIATHGILSGPAIERINACEMITRVIVTDTIDQTANAALCPKLAVVQTGPLFAKVIEILTNGGSISALFKDGA